MAWPTQALNLCIKVAYEPALTVSGIKWLGATHFKKKGCPAEWRCPIGRCYRTTNDDQRCVSTLDGRTPAFLGNECYQDSTDCVATLDRASATLLSPLVINGRNTRAAVTKKRPRNGAYMLNLTISDAVRAGGDGFFFIQGEVWVSKKAKPEDRALGDLAMRVEIRRPVKTLPTTAPTTISTTAPTTTRTKAANSGLSMTSRAFCALAAVAALWSALC